MCNWPIKRAYILMQPAVPILNYSERVLSILECVRKLSNLPATLQAIKNEFRIRNWSFSARYSRPFDSQSQKVVYLR